MRLTSNNRSAQKANFGKKSDPIVLPSSSDKIMSDEEFAKIGMNHIAYISVKGADNGSCIIHAADGHTIAITDTHEAARAMVFANGLTPVMLH